jgi:hypothetical protein
MFAKPSALVADCLRARDQTGWEKIVVDFWSTPIVISMAIDAIVLALGAHHFDPLLYAPLMLLYYLYAVLKWLVAAFALHWMLLCLRIKGKADVAIACYTVGVWYAPIYSLFGSVSFYYGLRALSQIKAQNLSLLGSIKYLAEHAKEMVAATELKIVTDLLQGASEAVFIISAVLVAECLMRYLLGDRLKIYLAVYFSVLLAFIPTILLAMFRWIILWPGIP